MVFSLVISILYIPLILPLNLYTKKSILPTKCSIIILDFIKNVNYFLNIFLTFHYGISLFTYGIFCNNLTIITDNPYVKNIPPIRQTIENSLI